MRASCVAMQSPMPPRRISGKQTVPRPRSGLSFMVCSLWRNSAMDCVRSRFHSIAFIAKSRWASKITLEVDRSPNRIGRQSDEQPGDADDRFGHRPRPQSLDQAQAEVILDDPETTVIKVRKKKRAAA